MKTYPSLLLAGNAVIKIGERTAAQLKRTEEDLDREVAAKAQQGRWPFNASATACFGGGCKITGEET